MEAFRQFATVKNHQVSITLPDHFEAEEVEVIILAKDKDNYLTEEIKSTLNQRVLEPESEYITSKESLEKIKKKYGF